MAFSAETSSSISGPSERYGRRTGYSQEISLASLDVFDKSCEQASIMDLKAYPGTIHWRWFYYVELISDSIISKCE
jgi:hypothetical protein